MDGRQLSLHGRDADADAARQAATAGDAADVLVIGLYPASLLTALLAVPGRRVLVVEPDASWAARVRSMPEARAALDSGRVTLHGLGEPADRLWQHFTKPQAAPARLVHPVLARESPDAVEAASLIAERAFAAASANWLARLALAPSYLRHTLANVDRVARAFDVSAFARAWQGSPIIVLGAGPSLDDALPFLRERQEQALLIATDTALRPCLSAGVAPQICIATDPSLANGRHLADLCPPDTTWLFAEASVQPAAMAPFADRTVLFRIADHDPWPWLVAHGVERTRLRAWGSVLTTAFDLALVLGGDPIIFAGADLAYTGGRPYCHGTTYESDWQALRDVGYADEAIFSGVMMHPLLQQADVRGDATSTAAHLLAFRDWLVQESARVADRRVVNATGAGILHGRGIHLSTLEDVLPPDCPRVRSLADVVATSPVPQQTLAIREAITPLLWALQAGASRATWPLERWRDFSHGQITDHEVRTLLAGVSARLDLPRQPVVRRVSHAPMAQDDVELLAAFGWIDAIDPLGVYVEIGSRFGGSLHAMARFLGRDVTLVAIDLPNGPWGHADAPAVLMQVVADLGRDGYDVHVIDGNSHDASVRHALRAILDSRSIDVLLLDGDRTFDGISADIDDYGSLLRPGGLLLMHDVATVAGPAGLPLASLPHASANALRDGAAAFRRCAEGRRSAMTTHAYGLGAIWW